MVWHEDGNKYPIIKLKDNRLWLGKNLNVAMDGALVEEWEDLALTYGGLDRKVEYGPTEIMGFLTKKPAFGLEQITSMMKLIF